MNKCAKRLIGLQGNVNLAVSFLFLFPTQDLYSQINPRMKQETCWYCER